MRNRRGGRTHAMVIPDTGLATIQNEIHGAVEAGSQIYTDEHGAYSDLNGLFFAHDTVNHGAGEYARGSAHTSGRVTSDDCLGSHALRSRGARPHGWKPMAHELRS